MIKADALIASAEKCMGWPYVSPGSNDRNGIDCSGLFVRIFRDNGGSIYHGSNTIWRKYTTRKGEIKNVSDLKPGMAVFKWKAQTPDKWKDNQGNFYHIGIVASVNPLRIIQASSVKGKVVADESIGKWKYWAELKGVAYGESGSAEGTHPTLRKGDVGTEVYQLQSMLMGSGYDLGRWGIDGEFGNDTEKAVRAFQKAAGLTVDGIVGPATWAALEGKETANAYYVKVTGLTMQEAEAIADTLQASGRTVTIMKEGV